MRERESERKKEQREKARIYLQNNTTRSNDHRSNLAEELRTLQSFAELIQFCFFKDEVSPVTEKNLFFDRGPQ